MNKIEFVRSAYASAGPDNGDWFSDDFQWTDELGSPPMDKDSFIGMGMLLQSAFPDIALIIDDIREEGDTVVVKSHNSGTFVNDLDLSSLGLGVVPATGKALDFPAQRDRVSFDGDKISEMHNLETGPQAGIAGLLKTLGVEMG